MIYWKPLESRLINTVDCTDKAIGGGIFYLRLYLKDKETQNHERHSEAVEGEPGFIRLHIQSTSPPI